MSAELPSVTNAPALTVYSARGVDHNLPEMPSVLIRGDIAWEDTHLYALGGFVPLVTPRMVGDLFDAVGVPNTHTGLEMIVGKHHGLQENWEFDASYFLRFAGWSPFDLRIRPGVGVGLSYAAGKPSYEDGPKHDPDRRYHLQNFNAYEVEWSLGAYPGVALVTRIHHRSGVYGLIAPRHVGSNFLAAGVRVNFD